MVVCFDVLDWFAVVFVNVGGYGLLIWLCLRSMVCFVDLLGD